MRVIISGGGTAGHINPAVAVANELKRRNAQTEILFVGAKGRMEMKRVPKAGYPIVGLWISGLQRKLTWKNLWVPFKVAHSLVKARMIIRKFKPDVVAGFGGFASGPTVRVASLLGIPTLIQEQNSFPGLTNRILAKKVDRICVAYPDVNENFPAEKVILTGNPVRADLQNLDDKKGIAASFFDLGQNKKTLLIFGGSLGAKTLNESVRMSLDLIETHPDILFLWQLGESHFEEYKKFVPHDLPSNLRMYPYIERMDLAYALADLAVCRAGALTLAELAVVGQAAILVPSPWVAEDHQTKNAVELVKSGGALLIKDQDARQSLISTAIDLLKDQEGLRKMSSEMKKWAKPNAAADIVNEIEKLIEK